MSLCKTGQIQNCCQPNALITLKEFLMDYATPETKKIGEEFILKELDKIENEAVKKVLTNNLKEIENGKRDLDFSEQEFYDFDAENKKSLDSSSTVSKRTFRKQYQVTNYIVYDLAEFIKTCIKRSNDEYVNRKGLIK